MLYWFLIICLLIRLLFICKFLFKFNLKDLINGFCIDIDMFKWFEVDELLEWVGMLFELFSNEYVNNIGLEIKILVMFCKGFFGYYFGKGFWV